MVADRVVEPFEESMATLHTVFPAFVSSNRLTFRHRFALLEYRARYVWISDSLRLSHEFSSKLDPSSQLQCMAYALRDTALAECCRCITLSAESISEAEANYPTDPCLEVELRLQELAFIYLLQSTVGIGAVGSELTIEQERNADARLKAHTLDLANTFHSGRVTASLSRIIHLCKSYPNSAGQFEAVALAFQSLSTSVGSNHPTVPAHAISQSEFHSCHIPQIYTSSTRKTERAWGNYVLNNLVRCKNKHPYSSVSFKKGCPECGVLVKLREWRATEGEFEQNAAFLKEDAFLRAMNGAK